MQRYSHVVLCELTGFQLKDLNYTEASASIIIFG